MSADTAHKAFLGDAEHVFQITPALIPELEHVCNIGVGTLIKRFTEGNYRFGEITQTIRLGLIGGGMTPESAARLCSTYVEARPLSETFPLALAILERLWFGAEIVDMLAKLNAKGADDAA